MFKLPLYKQGEKMKFIGVVLVAALPLVAFANPAHDKINSLSEADRGAIFTRLLSGGGERCPSASRTVYQGSDNKGNAYWNVQCTGALAYMIQISNNATGSTKVLECGLMKKANFGTCFKKF